MRCTCTGPACLSMIINNILYKIQDLCSALVFALNQLDILSNQNIHVLEGLRPLVASSLHVECYSPGPSAF